jgi:type I restriction enzyme, S subunit
MKNWKQDTLFTFCQKIGSGATPRGGDASYKVDGISLIRSQNVLDYTFSKDGLAFIDEQQAKELANVEIKSRDVLINITGDSVARVCQVPENVLPARVNQHVAILRANSSVLSPEFLKYSLLSNKNKELLLSLASTGATRKALTKGMLEQFEIDAPQDVKDQERIASILSSLDDKIELNRRMNQTLEQIAATLFKKYFVDDIDPDNLPDGWSTKTIEELSLKVGMGPFGANIKVETFTASGMSIISGQNLNTTILEDKTYNHISFEHAEKLKNSIVTRGDVIFTHAGNIGQVSLIPESSKFEKYILSQRQFYLRPNPDIISGFYLVLFFKSVEGQYKLLSHASSTGVPSISQPVTNLRRIKIIVPEKSVNDKFHRIVSSLYDLVSNNNRQIEKLTVIRDTLLPKLMSGEIDLSAINQNAPLHVEVLS